MDKVDPTPARLGRADASLWDEDAQHLLDEYVETEPFLVRISAAKRLRERVERDARRAGETRITSQRVSGSLMATAVGNAE
jgi:chlorophyllide a reductase subunit Z